MRNRIIVVGCWIVFAVAVPALGQEPAVIHLGMVDSLVKDLSPGKQKLGDADFPDMVKEFTGMQSKVFQGGDPLTAAKKLADGQWHLGIFQGVEFAWAQAPDAKLQPLMVAIGTQKSVHAVLVVKADNNAQGFANLKGKNVALHLGREHCRLFADKESAGDAKKFFGKVVATNNAETTLNEVFFNKIDAAIMDNSAFESFKGIQPGRFNKLKVLAQSEPFPATVIAYRQGGLSEGVLKRFKTGMLKANDSDKGRDMMANFNIVAFAAPPEDYAKQLSAIMKAYPAPTK